MAATTPLLPEDRPRYLMGVGQPLDLLDTIAEERGSLDGFDIAVRAEPGEPVPAFAADTATWAVHSWPAVADPDAVFNTVVHGPPS